MKMKSNCGIYSVLLLFGLSSAGDFKLEDAIAGFGDNTHQTQDPTYKNKMDTRRIKEAVYKIGNKIAEGVGTRFAEDSKRSDPSLTYSIVKTNNEALIKGNPYQVVDVVVRTKSTKLRNPKTTFRIFLDVEKTSGTVVGTVYNMLVNGKPISALKSLNNKSYIDTKEGTDEVAVINGQLQRVSAPTQADERLSNTKSSSKTSIVGKWNPEPMPEESYLLEFKADGKYAVYGGEDPFEGKYSVSGNRITMKDERFWDFQNAKLDLNGGTLKISGGENQSMDLEFKKQ